MNDRAPEAEREEAIRALAEVGDQSDLDELIVLYDRFGTPNFKLVLMRAISIMIVRLQIEELNKGDGRENENRLDG